MAKSSTEDKAAALKTPSVGSAVAAPSVASVQEEVGASFASESDSDDDDGDAKEKISFLRGVPPPSASASASASVSSSSQSFIKGETPHLEA